MYDSLTTNAEKKALEAQSLSAFNKINLNGIKSNVEKILGLIGRDGIFDEYTVHDISHINAMLEQLDWLIPAESQLIMTSADWLMIVLAIYFHDLGMLVTKKEYGAREGSGFEEFCETTLFADDEGFDYKEKVSSLDSEDAQRFLYQEYVRHNHAKRIRSWVTGKASDHLGCNEEAVHEVSTMLEPLGDVFREDLGIVCESHHLDDLDNLDKYMVSRPYGTSAQEAVNLQYVAVLLRTADLLHVTKDRTPSVTFRLISPEDPVSQKEWAKQAAVRAVRYQLGKDKDGNPAEEAPRDTIEVHARFKSPDGYFGLTSYLHYVESQLVRSGEWVALAEQKKGSKYRFPWRHIDSNAIETDGFLGKPFGFVLDQTRILDLLTGHTLYNDTSVVLRELIQNSLDAIRLRKHIGESSGGAVAPGSVNIHWDSKRRVLSVSDSGTGMTQGEIERHLLKVGSSRYQDPEFQENYPEFSSISRFGIGILSTFMIANDVEIVTCHSEEKEARKLVLRSVHGKYLIRLLDKSDGEVPKHIANGGTCVSLHIRPSAKFDDVLKQVRHWLVVPGCEVNVTEDNNAAVKVGYGSPKEALADVLSDSGFIQDDSPSASDPNNQYKEKIRIEQVNVKGLTIAYVLRWSYWFKSWSFCEAERLGIDSIRDVLGTCIEGIRVDFMPPGFQGWEGIAAIVNAQGPGAPKTNVARTGLEKTAQYDSMMRDVYKAYCDHLVKEFDAMQADGNLSLTWAVGEIRELVMGLYRTKACVGEILDEQVDKLPAILVETSGAREVMSIEQLKKKKEVWVVDSQLLRSAGIMIREVSSSTSVKSLIAALDVNMNPLPEGVVICDIGVRQFPFNSIFGNKEVDKIVIDHDLRRLDLRWSDALDSPRWADIDWKVGGEDFVRRELFDRHRLGTEVADGQIRVLLSVDRGGVEIDGRGDVSGVIWDDHIFVLGGSPIACNLLGWVDLYEQRPEESVANCGFKVFEHVYACFRNRASSLTDRGKVLLEFNSVMHAGIDPLLRTRVEESIDVIVDDSFNIFDSFRWSRQHN